MAIEPELLLADEPTGNLDSASSREIMGLLRAFNENRGITVVMVTHDGQMAAYADRIIHFLDGLIHEEELNGGGRA
jgi:putative ABC transport system ATP-binding protein